MRVLQRVMRSHARRRALRIVSIPCLAVWRLCRRLPALRPVVAGLPLGLQNAGMPLRLPQPDARRRSCLLAALPWLPWPALAADTPLRDAMRRAEMEAIRDAARRLQTRDLSGCALVSTSRPCRMCEAAAGWAGISRMVYGAALPDAGAPR